MQIRRKFRFLQIIAYDKKKQRKREGREDGRGKEKKESRRVRKMATGGIDNVKREKISSLTVKSKL